MKSNRSSVRGHAVQALVCRVARRCIGLLSFTLLCSTAVAQQETLGAILDNGAKKMSSAEIRAAVKAGSLRGFPAGSLQNVSYETGGDMAGYSPDGGFWITGEWTVDARGQQCFYWAGWGGKYCFFWFKLGESIYLVDSEADSKSEPNRGQSIRKLNPS